MQTLTNEQIHYIFSQLQDNQPITTAYPKGSLTEYRLFFKVHKLVSPASFIYYWKQQPNKDLLLQTCSAEEPSEHQLTSYVSIANTIFKDTSCKH